jgi:hypothetical protein
MRGLGRVLGFGLFTDWNDPPRTSLQGAVQPSRRLLFQCETCGGRKRTRRSHPRCKGTDLKQHLPARMRSIPDFGQVETEGLRLASAYGEQSS